MTDIPSWAWLLISAAVAALVAIAVRRWRLRTFRWPRNIGQADFEHLCARYLRRRGWDVQPSDNTYASFAVASPDIGCVLSCKLQGGTVGESLFFAMRSEIRPDRRAAVIYADPPTPAKAEECRVCGVHMLHYTELGRLHQIIAAPAPNPQAAAAQAALENAPPAWGVLRSGSWQPGDGQA